ncbi:MAG: hypothetical protein ACOYM3_00240 [Terrimicrobiaceae bacterium]
MILAFVVLLTVLVLAYFSYSSLQRQISSASSNQATVDLFAQGAINTIVSDFKQEIYSGSSNSAYGTNTVSIPLTSSNAAPVLVGTSTNLPNLIKRSASGLAFSPGGAIRASAAPSTTASQNGRSMSPARWNASLLLPKANTNSATDLTPANFTPPDWILVNRGGGNPTTWNTNMIWTPDMANANSVIGRFAYAIYDEGGLLDVNVAGYPPGTTNTISSYKNALSYADLTQVGLDTNTISALVGWRNFASAQPGGTLPNYSFSPASQTNFYQTVSTNASGFMRTANTSLAGGETDHMFLSRQQLIQFFNRLADSGLQTKAALQNAIQFLGTFSRGLDQPSFAPDPGRPKIVGSAVPPANASSYQGNNAYFGGESAINLAGTGGFLSVRVTGNFTRLDGSSAVVGEPLVKKKFALSNLSRVATTATASQSASDPIYSRFGLYRASASSPWVYNHGSNFIMTLSQVAALTGAAAREPDFAELLKAAINAGSVGKGAYTNQGNNYSYTVDVSGDRQILQIMANLIDQTKTDNYPTAILPFNNNTSTVAVFGTQDLPYFYNWHFFSMTTRLPSPLLSNADTVLKSVLIPTPPAPPLPAPAPTPYPGTANHIRAAALIDPGSASYMIVPQIWRPHDANTPQVTGPTVFRVLAETTDPSGTLGYWKIKAAPEMNGQSFDGANDLSALKPPDSAKSTPAQLDASNGALQFTDSSNGRAFREPTLLWRNGIPGGVSLSGISRTEDVSLSGKTYFGILVGDAHVSWSATMNGTAYVCQSSTMQRGTSVAGPSGSINDNMTFRMQYQDAGGSWVTYQNVFAEATLPDIPGYSLFVNSADCATKQYANPLNSFGQWGSSALTAPRGGPYDPRSSRLATPVRGYFDQDDPTLNGNPTLDAVTMKNNSLTLTIAENQAVADSDFVLMATQRPSTSRGQNYNWTNPAASFAAQQGFYSSSNFNTGGNFGGLFSQNNPAITLAGGVQNYYEDPDGICRRAMGGYVPAGGAASGRLTNTGSTVGLPLATASNSFSNGLGSPTSQSQSRPIILHRPFRSVGEMSYAFRGTPWKNIDFFTPESGDTALLDVFCVNEAPPDAMVAGKVNLNTRQPLVLQSILAGAYRDEWANLATLPGSGTLPALSVTEAQNVANKLVGITTAGDSWRGPLANIGDLVGHFVPNAGTVSGTDAYQYTSRNPAGTLQTYTYAGLSGALDSSVYTSSPTSSTSIQRFRESAIRPLAACGQVRVWNLLIDVVAQTGKFPASASALSNFLVEGEKRYWVHIAIDRSTGQVIDKQLELVTE